MFDFYNIISKYFNYIIINYNWFNLKKNNKYYDKTKSEKMSKL